MYLEYLGYAASLIVLISLLMSSLKKLRWINLFGATLFGFYGFMIGSIPTGMMNLGIVIIDVYYLVKMYKGKEFFQLLPFEGKSEYLKSFIKFYKEDIESYVNISKVDIENASTKLYILRNMTPAGLFIADKADSTTLEIKVDYVVPQYRDFKLGAYVFKSQREEFLKLGYKEFLVYTKNEAHIKYVKKMGFKEATRNKVVCFTKAI